MPGAYRNNELIAGAGGTAATGRGTLADIRWRPVRNTTDETIPPFALMAMWGARRDDNSIYQPYESGGQKEFSSLEERDGQIVWLVKKPGIGDEALQQPWALVVNSALEIAPGQYGMGTQDWPVPCLFESGTAVGSSVADGYVFTHCGPKAGSWELNGSGTAFMLLTPDETESPGNNKTIMWVAPNRPGRERYIVEFGGRTFALNASQTLKLNVPHSDCLVAVEPGVGAISSQSQLLLGLENGELKFSRDARVLLTLTINVRVGSATQIGTAPVQPTEIVEIQPKVESSTGKDVFAVAYPLTLDPIEWIPQKVVEHVPPYSQNGIVMPSGGQSRVAFGYYAGEKGDTLALKIQAGSRHNDVRGKVSAQIKIEELW